MIDAAALLKLNTLGLSAEQYAGVLDVIASATRDVPAPITVTPAVTPPSANALRQRRFREARKALRETDSNASATVGEAAPLAPSPQKETPPPAPPLKKNTPHPRTPSLFGASEGDAFDQFWDVFPNKVGKADARKAFDKAIRKIQIGPMLDALQRYASKADDRPWCNPATWLNQERWADQPAQVARGSPAPRQRQPTALELRTQRLRERIENEHGLGRERGGDHSDDERIPLVIEDHGRDG